MPNGNTSMQYPFPYKNISGSEDIITNGNFVIVDAGTLNVTGDATISGTTTTSILVVSGAATANAWDGSGSLNGDLFSSQSNTNAGTSATAMYRMFNSSDDKFDIAIASRLNSTYNGKALIKSTRSIYVNTSTGEEITLNTNGIARLTVSDSGVTLSQGLAIGSGGTGRTTIGTNGQVLTSDGASLVYTTPSTGTVSSVAASVPAFLSISGSPITSSGTLAIGLSGTALPVANGGTGVTVSSGASSVVLRDATQNVYVNRLNQNVTNVVTSGGTTVLTNGSSYEYQFTGASSQTLQLPDATTLTVGTMFLINNNAVAGSISVVKNDGSAFSPTTTIPFGGAILINCLTNVTTNGTWDYHALAPSGIYTSSTWGATALTYTGNFIGNNLQSTVATGSAPLVVASTTKVANLNVNALNGVTFATPTASRAVELDASSQFVVNTITGTGSYVKENTPTLVTPVLGAATATSITYGGVTTKNISGTYNFNLPTTAGTAGQVLTSGAGGSTAMTWSNPATYYGALSYYLTGNQTLSNSTNAIVNWTGTVSGSSSTTGITATSGTFTNASGSTIVVQIMCSLLFDVNSSGQRYAFITDETIGDICLSVAQPTTDYTSITTSATFQVLDTKTFSIKARQNRGANLDLIGGSNGCIVSVTRLA